MTASLKRWLGLESPHAEAARKRDVAGPLIQLRDVGVVLSGHTVLSHVGFDILPGEIITVVGPNGAGKTTLARVLMGVIDPNRGQVHRRRNLRIGYVPQRLAVDTVFPMSVLRLMSLTGPCPNQIARATLDEVGALHLIDRPVHALSGGEMQRVLLARALARSPDLLVLDEPSQNLDYTGQSELYTLVGRLRDRRGCGVLIISHDLHVVMSSTDRVICLNGHLCCIGTPEVVSDHPDYKALLGPHAAEAFALYRHHHDHDHSLSGDVVEAGRR